MSEPSDTLLREWETDRARFSGGGAIFADGTPNRTGAITVSRTSLRCST